MSLSSTYISRKQLIADNLNTMGETTADVSDGLTTLANKILDIPNKQSTTLTMDVPLNLEYGDDFNITGSLTSGGDGVSNATIKLKVGSTVVDTDTTDGSGEVTFTHCPVRTGNHSFQLVFEGDLNHASSESTIVYRDVAKETAVISLDYPIASSNHYSDEDIVVSGVLTDNDDTPLANKDILVKDGNAIAIQITTDSDGSFSDTINLNTGSHTINVVYNGDENYTASSVSRNVTIVAPSLSLTSDKDILSYNGGVNPDSATLTATLNAFDNAGKTVTFEVRKQSDDSLVETLTGDTNSSGIATVSYLGEGVGDLNIKAECRLLTQIFAIEDCCYYNSGTLNSDTTLSIQNMPTNFYASFTTHYSGSSGRISWLMVGADSNNHIFFGQVGGTVMGIFKKVSGSNTNISSQSILTSSTDYLQEFTYEDGALTLKCGSTTLTGSYIHTDRNYVVAHIESNNVMKGLKIKPL